MIYQVNAKGYFPYYTTDRDKARSLHAYFCASNCPSSIRTTTRARAIWGAFKAGGLPADV